MQPLNPIETGYESWPLHSWDREPWFMEVNPPSIACLAKGVHGLLGSHDEYKFDPENSQVKSSGQFTIVHQPRFPWNQGSHFPSLATFWGEVMWGRYNLDRIIWATQTCTDHFGFFENKGAISNPCALQGCQPFPCPISRLILKCVQWQSSKTAAISVKHSGM